MAAGRARGKTPYCGYGRTRIAVTDGAIRIRATTRGQPLQAIPHYWDLNHAGNS